MRAGNIAPSLYSGCSTCLLVRSMQQASAFIPPFQTYAHTTPDPKIVEGGSVDFHPFFFFNSSLPLFCFFLTSAHLSLFIPSTQPHALPLHCTFLCRITKSHIKPNRKQIKGKHRLLCFFIHTGCFRRGQRRREQEYATE